MRRRRELPELGRGDRAVLTFALGVGFVWLLRHWQTPIWLSAPALVSAWLVVARYRWITGGRDGARRTEDE